MNEQISQELIEDAEYQIRNEQEEAYTDKAKELIKTKQILRLKFEQAIQELEAFQDISPQEYWEMTQRENNTNSEPTVITQN